MVLAEGEAMGKEQPFSATLKPWLCVRGSLRALAFYQAAFGAIEVYRLGDGDSIVARLSIEGAEFWMSDESPDYGNYSPESLGGITTRLMLGVADPDATFARAVEAGAKVVRPVEEMYGWRVGRVVDPFGHHWEICRELAG
jgi:PhnB protein